MMWIKLLCSWIGWKQLKVYTVYTHYSLDTRTISPRHFFFEYNIYESLLHIEYNDTIKIPHAAIIKDNSRPERSKVYIIYTYINTILYMYVVYTDVLSSKAL